jgi:hypothetical protein
MAITQTTRLALKARLVGTNSIEVGRIKELSALLWIYRWGWSWPELLDLVGGSKGSGLARRLEKNNLLISMTPQAAGLKDTPKKALILTKEGLNEATKQSEMLLRYALDIYKLRQTHFRHDVFCQRATAKKMACTPNFSFMTEREMAAQSQPDMKQPDILWMEDGVKTAIEVELTAKWERDLDQFVLGTLKSLNATADSPARFDRMFLFTDAPAIKTRYEAAFKSGAKLAVWGKNDQGKWAVQKTLTVPEWTKEKVQCFVV